MRRACEGEARRRDHSPTSFRSADSTSAMWVETLSAAGFQGEPGPRWRDHPLKVTPPMLARDVRAVDRPTRGDARAGVGVEHVDLRPRVGWRDLEREQRLAGGIAGRDAVVVDDKPTPARVVSPFSSASRPGRDRSRPRRVAAKSRRGAKGASPLFISLGVSRSFSMPGVRRSIRSVAAPRASPGPPTFRKMCQLWVASEPRAGERIADQDGRRLGLDLDALHVEGPARLAADEGLNAAPVQIDQIMVVDKAGRARRFSPGRARARRVPRPACAAPRRRRCRHGHG